MWRRYLLIIPMNRKKNIKLVENALVNIFRASIKSSTSSVSKNKDYLSAKDRDRTSEYLLTTASIYRHWKPDKPANRSSGFEIQRWRFWRPRRGLYMYGEHADSRALIAPRFLAKRLVPRWRRETDKPWRVLPDVRDERFRTFIGSVEIYLSDFPEILKLKKKLFPYSVFVLAVWTNEECTKLKM